MVLKHKDFRILWIGQLVSKLGSQFNYIALAWLVLKTTESAAAASGVYLAQVLPAALLGWAAGVYVDRTDRRSMMLHYDWLRAALVLILPLAFAFDKLSIWLIYAVTFAISILTLAFYAAEKSVIPQIVPEQDLTEANAFAEMTEQIGALAGPVIAGILIALLPSPIYLLYADAASFLFSAITILLLKFRDKRETSPASVAMLWNEAKEGIVHLLKDPLLRIIILTACSINFLAAPFTVVFPVFSERVLQAGSEGFGWLMGAFGLGMLIGSFGAAPLAKRFTPAQIIYSGMLLMGIGFIALAFSPNLTVAVILAAITSFGVGPGNAVIITLIQQKTPENMLGRIFAAMSGIVQAAIPIGVGIAGPLLDAVGSVSVLIAMGAGSLICTAFGYYFLKKVI